ncbi:MAG: class I SAM-dependent methyltransferase [candidate division Zixibacteria bacterium]|nr:class I SAM-dependent methyltransferase [candidate division Zixibacteria bacterium]MBU1472113.1 class I SAM-dependent methyltransferase [candidate division Zixibacteria bacterium]MBU2626232.1 class I SAM-dependent methyltransferase [candidate division Zixibacteria bacterium]
MNYSKLAPYYDLLGWADFTFHILPHIRSFFRAIGSPPERYLDIACGTGVLASILADENIRITGIDINPEMIREAKKREYSIRPNFRVADMCKFDLRSQFPVTGCFYDAINHLASEEDVRKAFRCAFLHTEPGGYYIFDINTPLGLERWSPYCSQQRNRFIVTQDGTYDKSTGTRDIKIEAFVKDSNDEVRYVNEMIREKAYPLSFIQHALAEAGFRKFAFEPFRNEGTVRDAERLFTVCRR